MMMCQRRSESHSEPSRRAFSDASRRSLVDSEHRLWGEGQPQRMMLIDAPRVCLGIGRRRRGPMNDDRTQDSASSDGGDITRLLRSANNDTPGARDELLRTVYHELKRIAASHMAGERPEHTLGATGLVNEAYLRLFVSDGAPSTPFERRQAFYQAATTAMRRILIDHARAKLAAKRGGAERRAGRQRISADLLEASADSDPADLIALDEALDDLQRDDERAAEVVRLRFYAGRQLAEIADVLGVSTRTVKRDWEYARARLQQILDDRERVEPR